MYMYVCIYIYIYIHIYVYTKPPAQDAPLHLLPEARERQEADSPLYYLSLSLYITIIQLSV